MISHVTPVRKISLAALFYALLILLAYFTQRDNFLQLLGLFSGLFGCYLLMLRFIKSFSIREIVLIAILFRVALLLMTPNLSDDFWRFIWDGRIVAAGENPYLCLPQEAILDPEIQQLGLEGEVYDNLNSKQYFTIYPPLNQLLFGLSALLGFGNPAAEMFALRLLLLAAEIGVIVLMIRLLRHFNLDERRVAWYAFNPLVIIEVTGNLHFEGLMVFFLMLAAWLWVRKRLIPATLALAGAISAKLLPLIVLALLPRFLGWKRAFAVGGLTLAVTALTFSIFVGPEFVANLSSSLDLYFRRFEFNASIYYLIREVGFAIVGYNAIQYIGPMLSLVTLGVILLIALGLRKKQWNFFQALTICLTVYFLLTTTVHPWYIVTLVGLAPLCGWRFALLWSGVVILSYSHYWGGGFEENYLLIAAEYLALAVGGFFLLKGQKVLPAAT